MVTTRGSFLRRYYSSDSSSGPKMTTIRPLVIAGPSGVGKGTLHTKLREEFPGAFALSVSHTTRAPREGEEDGVHYHYVSRDEMKRGIAAGEFIEHAEFRSGDLSCHLPHCP